MNEDDRVIVQDMIWDDGLVEDYDSIPEITYDSKGDTVLVKPKKGNTTGGPNYCIACGGKLKYNEVCPACTPTSIYDAADSDYTGWNPNLTPKEVKAIATALLTIEKCLPEGEAIDWMTEALYKEGIISETQYDAIISACSKQTLKPTIVKDTSETPDKYVEIAAKLTKLQADAKKKNIVIAMTPLQAKPSKAGEAAAKKKNKAMVKKAMDKKAAQIMWMAEVEAFEKKVKEQKQQNFTQEMQEEIKAIKDMYKKEETKIDEELEPSYQEWENPFAQEEDDHLEPMMAYNGMDCVEYVKVKPKAPEIEEVTTEDLDWASETEDFLKD